MNPPIAKKKTKGHDSHQPYLIHIRYKIGTSLMKFELKNYYVCRL